MTYFWRKFFALKYQEVIVIVYYMLQKSNMAFFRFSTIYCQSTLEKCFVCIAAPSNTQYIILKS